MTTLPSTSYVGFRAGAIAPALAARREENEPLGAVARADLADYYALLGLDRPTFSVGEALLLCDALNGTRIEAQTATLLWASISDALEDGLAEKWDVAGTALVARLRTLSRFEAWQVLDACRQFWNRADKHLDATNEERVRSVGLVRGEQ